MHTIKISGQDINLHFRNLRIEQSIGAHHQFELIVGSEEKEDYFKGSLAENSKKWIGQPLEVEGLFKGVVTSVSLSRVGSKGSDFIIQGQSPTIYLDDGIHARSFGEKSLKQIIDNVSNPYKSKFDNMEISPQYHEKIKYCVQYRESHFSFMNRLAARYGEWLFYDGYGFHFGKLAESAVIRLNYEYDMTHLDLSIKSLPVNFKLKAYDYKGHKFPEKTASYDAIENEYAKIAFEKSKQDLFPKISEVPIHFSMSEKDLEQITTLRQNLNLNELVVLSGTSQRDELRLGSIIEVVDSRESFEMSEQENYGKYIIVKLMHEISEEGEGYVNHFEAIPKGTVVPPLSISPDPPLCEMQEGEIVENNDKKGLGRVRVQFMWQKELEGDDSKTPWIRVSSHSGGGDKGLYILPEKGDRVLVAFEHNHPERPFVLTSVYHGESKPEHHDPQNLKKVLKTKGGHQILMNDEKGKESMALSSPFDFSASASGGDMTLTAKSKITIKSDSGDITINTPTNISIDADGNITVNAKGDITIEAVNINLKGKASINLEAPKIEINAKAQLNQSGAQVTIEGQATTTVKGGTMLNLESSGITNVSGTMLKLN
jgi:type VI secretion system secreted protein VgrG